MNRGTLLVILMLAAGLAAAVGAIWHQYRQTHEPLVLWGSEMARLIDRADFVMLTDFRHGDPRKIAENPASRGELRVVISDARGMVHFRRSLLEKSSFELDDEGRVQRSNGKVFKLQYAVSFTDDRDRAEMLGFDLDNRLVHHLGSMAVLTERTAKGMEQFFREKLSEAHGLP
jgi:hypothetical protein